MSSDDAVFLSQFMALSVVSGLTVGLGKIITTLYALSLGATPFQIGVISAMESIGMVLVTVPAGFIIARYGARGVYFLASLGPMLVNLVLPVLSSWVALAAGRWFIGLCIPFRIVSMNSSFLERLPSLGEGKGGWYRASLTGGIAIVGPSLAAVLTAHASVTVVFWVVAALFGLMAIFSLGFLPERNAPASDEPSLIEQVQTLFAHPGVAESCLAEFASSATNALFSTFIIVLAASMAGLTAQDGIHILLVQGFFVVGLLLWGGKTIARLPTSVVYAISATAAALALPSLAFANGLPGLAFGAALLALGSASLHLVNVRMLVALPGGKSKIAGFYNLASMTGSSFGAIIGGALTELVPLQTVFLLWLPVLGAAGLGIRALHLRLTAQTSTIAHGGARP